ncbi:hypothetical protein [Ferrovum sp.]|uniref:hypothetical protein n=1 Tax=Ferrovum sp. TaxID=2609467 RepID=UPI002616261B|nr:hypothetical protein [Ferrovum sp.]
MSDDGSIEVKTVGDDFTPSPFTNATIDKLLGHIAEVKEDGKAYRFVADFRVPPEFPPHWEECPNYCEDIKEISALDEFEGIFPYIKPIRKVGKQRKTRYVCFFSCGEEIMVTVEFDKGTYALAAALKHVLLERNK